MEKGVEIPEEMTRKKSKKARQWRRADLHLHTPASADYEEPERGYLEILQRAESEGLDIIAFTDHNTAAGYGAMVDVEIPRLLCYNRHN